MTKAIRRLKNFDFSADDAHIALVDRAANGLSVLIKKRFGDMEKFDPESDSFVPLEESGLKVNMSLEDMLLFFTDLFPEDIETLTAAITKAADGDELINMLEVHVQKNPGAMPFDVFTARREAFQEQLAKLDTGAMDALRAASLVINEFLDRGIKPGESDSTSTLPDLVEKSEMTDENKKVVDENLEKDATSVDNGAEATPTSDVAVPESVQKALDESQATIQKQADQIASLQKAEDDRVTATFITKAAGYVEKGASLPEVAEGENAAEKFGLALKSLSAAAPEAYAQVESVLEKALDTIKNGDKLDTVGEDGQPSVSDNASALAKAAADLRKEDDSLTEQQAIAKAVEANPSLYNG